MVTPSPSFHLPLPHFIEKFHATTFFGGRVLQGKRPRRQIQFPAKGPQLRAKTITNSYVDIAKFLGAAK
jgi:hypothetical protein